ncbi:putative protein phosphatase 2C 73 [Iris pallida]|uniref:protein-serine/threonine phosphatase n=1 Tax=Iris pallida TaxID=29817 RepID=A0AAX6GH63_IRIPA|nr:putative protein phosphatase 2C 73 [Iris pallida]
MGVCCSKNREGIEGLAFKPEEEDEEDDDEEDEEENDENRLKFHYDSEEDDDDGEDGTRAVGDCGARVRLKGSCGFASMYSQQGWKGVNQDAMTIWEDFGGASGRIFCGVFDGHGPFGHRVACYARDKLPSKLSTSLDSVRPQFQAHRNDSDDDSGNDGGGGGENSEEFSYWKEAFLKAFEELDKELRNQSFIDCICSGSTAVSIVKLREQLIIANLGDSRAILATRDGKKPAPAGPTHGRSETKRTK